LHDNGIVLFTDNEISIKVRVF